MKRIIKPNTVIPGAKDASGFYTTTPKFTLHHHLFDKQLAFVKDPSQFRVAVCSRRSGKTVACAAHLLDIAINNPGTLSLYITLTMGMAKRIIQPVLDDLIRRYKIKAVYNVSDASYEFENMSKIYLAGAATKAEIEKFRGISKLRICYIDECQSFPMYIEELINDVIGPALIDLGGELNLIGTPGPIPSGFFYDCANSGTWALHGWTFWDNPHIDKKEEKFASELKRRGVASDSPSIRREWFGEWLIDADSLLLNYSEEINHFDKLPEANWTYLMGVDIGFNDADALAVLAWCPTSPNIYLVEEIISPNQDITNLMTQINALRKKYDIAKIVIDTGGLGKKISEELIRRHQIPLVAADKVRKMENIKLLNDFMRSGRFFAARKSTFASDSRKLEVDWNRSTPDRIVVSSKFHSDIIDAVLYAFKESYAYTYEKPEPKPAYGSREYFDEEMERLEAAAIEHALAAEDAASGFGDEFF